VNQILKPKYRLTLSAEAFALAVGKKSPLAGEMAFHRPDGRWDIAISMAIAEQLVESALPKENLSDTVIRTLSKPVSDQ
jgi:hypothetical protein